VNKKALMPLTVILVAALVVGVIVARNRRQAALPPSGGTDKIAEERGSVAAPTADEIADAKNAGTVTAVIETSRGNIALDLRGDLMPITVANFTKLAKAGFYDGLNFHRVEDWVIQGGDPRGDGTGGPGYTIKLETTPQLKNTRGAIAMARTTEPDSAGSQFYILRTDAPWLDGDYAVFGAVTSGLDVVDKMQQGGKISKVTISE
jgi:peptidyl-prolyl cis-trans isomerase B (cyclophilin B)